MADTEDSALKNHLNSSIQPNLERLNAKGINVKALHIKQFEIEYHNLIDEIRLNQNIKSVADAVRWALKKATGRV